MRILITVLSLLLSSQIWASGSMESHINEALKEPGALSQQTHDIFWIRMRDTYGEEQAENIAASYHSFSVNIQQLQLAMWDSARLSAEQGKVVHSEAVKQYYQTLAPAMKTVLDTAGIAKDQQRVEAEMEAFSYELERRKALFDEVLNAAVEGESVYINGNDPVQVSPAMIQTVTEGIEANMHKMEQLLSPDWEQDDLS